MTSGNEDYTTSTDIACQSLDRISTVSKSPSGTDPIFKTGSAQGDVDLMHTITDGKTFYLTNIALANSTKDTSAHCHIAVRDENDITQYILMDLTAAGEVGNGASVSMSMPIIPPFEIQAGWDIFLESFNANILASALISGWEE